MLFTKNMTKVSLIIIGIILLIISFVVLQVAFTPNDKTEIRNINSLCTSSVSAFGFNIPLGDIGQKLLGTDAQEACRKANYFTLLFDFGWIGYVLGGLLFIFGLVLGGGRKKYHEEKHFPQHFSKHCGECGSKLQGHEKHCPECGKKV